MPSAAVAPINSLARMDIGRPATFCLQPVQLRIHAGEFDYLCQSTESTTVMLGSPGCAQLPVDCPFIGHQKWLRSGHFLARHTRPRRAENLVLPLYRIVVQHMKNQILTEVTARLEGQHGVRYEESERRCTRK